MAYTCDISGWHNARNQLTAAKSCVMPCMHDACACDTMCMTCWVPEYPCMRIMVQGAMAEMCGHVRAAIPGYFCYSGTHVLHVYIFSTMPLYHFLLQATTLCHACMLGACMHHHVPMKICSPGMVPKYICTHVMLCLQHCHRSCSSLEKGITVCPACMPSSISHHVPM